LALALNQSSANRPTNETETENSMIITWPWTDLGKISCKQVTCHDHRWQDTTGIIAQVLSRQTAKNEIAPDHLDLNKTRTVRAMAISFYSLLLRRCRLKIHSHL
jgi:hypothetical protein